MELFHEVQRHAGPLIGGRVRDAEGRFEPGGVQRADAFGQEDGIPVGQGGVAQVAGWASAAPVEGDVGGHARGERLEVGVGARAFDAHDFVEYARLSRSTSAASSRTRVIAVVSKAWAGWGEDGSSKVMVTVVAVVGVCPTSLLF